MAAAARILTPHPSLPTHAADGSSNGSLGFPISAEASAFLSKKCKGPGTGIVRAVQGATQPALELIHTLLAVDPSKRPTAAQAIKSRYLAEAEVCMCVVEVAPEVSFP